MNSKKSHVFVGKLLLILGIVFIILNMFRIKYSMASLVILGTALLFLYITKRKLWALFGGSIVLICGGSGIFYNIPIVGEYLMGALLFFIPGVLLLTLYYVNDNYNYLIPSCFAIWSGIFIFLTSLDLFRLMAGSLFFICFGMGFLMVYLLGRKIIGTWAVFVSAGSFLLGLLFIVGNTAISMGLNKCTYIGCLLFLLINILLIVKGFKKK